MYKVGIIGLGRVGTMYDDDPLVKGIYTHFGAYMVNPETEIVAGSDIDKYKLKAFRKKCKQCTLYSDYSEMLKKEKLDIVSICTGRGIHYDIIKEAVKYNIKAIYCEKPMTDTLEKADEIIQLCKGENIIITVNHMRRWESGTQSIKKYIENREIGDIQKCTVYYNKGILNNGTHALDLLNFFFGDVDYVWSKYSYDEKEKDDPTLDVYLKFKNGLSGNLLGLNARYFDLFEIDILGTEGRICIKDSGFRFEYYKVQESNRFSGYKELYKKRLPFAPKLGDAMPQAVSDIIKCIKTGKKPLCSAEDARNSLAVIVAALESARKLGEKIFISR